MAKKFLIIQHRGRVRSNSDFMILGRVDLIFALG